MLRTIPLSRRGVYRVWGAAFLLLGLYLVPVLVSFCLPDPPGGVPWRQARRDPTGLSPDPARTQEAVIQVFAPPAVSWRGIFSVHIWVAVKPTGAPRFTRYEVLGFGFADGAPAVRIDRMGPDKHWFGAWPEILLDRRGAGVDEIIGQVRAAVANYPLSEYLPSLARPQQQYLPRAHRPAGPRAEIPLPSNAVGKDFLPGGGLFAAAPSGSGFQVSLYGLIGILLAAREGLEVNLLGLSFGVGPVRPALKLPALGRFRMAGL